MLLFMICQTSVYTDVGKKRCRCLSEGSADPIWSGIPSEDSQIKYCPWLPGPHLVPTAPDGRKIKIEPTLHKTESGVELTVILQNF